MLKGAKAKFGIIIVSILIICASAIGIMNAFAESALLTYRVDPVSVELDGTEDAEVTITLKSIREMKMLNLEGYFTPSNNYEGDHAPMYIRFVSGWSPNTSGCEVDHADGSFGCEFESVDVDDNWFEENGDVAIAYYSVSRDTPAGVYTLPISINYVEGRVDSISSSNNIREETLTLYAQVVVRRTQRVVFWDENGNPITEINKTYGDPDFEITKAVYEGDGSINGYYIDSEYDNGVVSIIPDSDYIQILKAGTTKICASISETEFYLPSESCFTVNVEPREIWVKKLTFVDRQYDGTDTVEIDELLFYTFAPDHTPIYVNLDPTQYNIWGPSVDSPNVGETIATVEIYLTDEAREYFYLDENTYTGPVTISPISLQNMSATVLPKEYDGTSLYPAVTPVIGTSDSGEVHLQEGEDFEIFYNNGDVYVDGNFVEAGDYQITVSPIAGSIYTFEPFEVTYTITPKIVSISYVELNDKVYDRTLDASVSSVSFGDVELTKDEDYEAYASLDNANAGEGRHATVYVTLLDHNYSFRYDDFAYEYVYQDTYNVSGVEVLPKELTAENTSYDLEDTYFTYTGEEIKPFISLSITFVDGEQPEDPLSLGLDYEIEYPEDTTNYGVKYATIVGKGNFCGSIGQISYMITGAPIQDIEVTTPKQTYTGESLEPVPIVTAVFNGERITIPANEYDVVHQQDFINVGDYTYTIQESNLSNFHFSVVDVSFTILPKEITVTGAEVNNKNIDWNNEATVNWVEFSQPDLINHVDYTATATLDDYNAGVQDATVYVTLSNPNYYFSYNEYSGTYSNETTYRVSGVSVFPRELTRDNTSIRVGSESLTHYSYTGYEIQPEIYVSAGLRDGDSIYDYQNLSLGTDFSVEYPEDTTNAGEKYVTITGIGNFSGSIPLQYYIDPYVLEDVDVYTPSAVYTGEPLVPEPVLTAMFYEDEITVPASEYELSETHEDYINVGDYNYLILDTGGPNLRFPNNNHLDAVFTITPYEISSSDISLSESTYKYNGTSQTPTVTVSVGNTTVDENEYDVEYSADTIGNDDSDTTVTVTVTAKEGANITGSASTTYTITPRDVLTIAGVDDNQQIGYTGSPVVLDGNVMVEENPGGIVAEDLTIQWYASDGTTIIDRPTNAGSYKVVYSYEDADYHGSLVINFEITKAASPSPAEMTAGFRIASGETLADLEGTRTIGFAWVDSSTAIVPGNNVYPATYTYNNDTVNYETLILNVPVYGLVTVNVTIPESENGEISVSSQSVLEGETITVTITPDFGYTLSSITVNGVNYTNSVHANTLAVVAGTSNLEIVATFVPITYEVTEGAEQIYVIDKDSVAKFRINASYELFENGGSVYVDDVLVDPENYTSWDGSTYIQLTKEYMNTLAVGTHTLKVVFNDGGTATTTFTITESNENEDLVTPNTGLFSMLGGGATVTIGSLALVLIAFITARKIHRKTKII